MASATPRNRSTILEICVDDVASAMAAAAGGADRIELCAALDVGGVTPSSGLIRACRTAVSIPVHVMIRPRAGDFVYSEAELDVIHHDIQVAGELGADGVVFGILTPDGRVDEARMHRAIRCAGSMAVTFHRAFDMLADPRAALPLIRSLDVHRILTSGGRTRAMDGASLLRELSDMARDQGPRIAAAAGITLDNVEPLLQDTGVPEVHVGSACRRVQPSPMSFRNPDAHMGSDPSKDEYAMRRTDPDLVRAFVEALP